MKEEDARELFDRVFRTQIPRVLHEHFCVPQYTGWEDETIHYAEACGLFPREREHSYQVGEARQEVETRYDVDLKRFLDTRRIKTLHPNQMYQFVAYRRRKHGEFDERPAFRRRTKDNNEPRLGLNLVEREDLS